MYVSFCSKSGTQGFIGIEVKYHENLRGQAADHRERYDEVANGMKCFKRDRRAQLQSQPLQQIWRDHLLAGSLRKADGYEEGFFVFLYPGGNTHCSEAIAQYRDCLTNTSTFDAWILEDVAAKVKQFTQGEWIDMFIDRYLDFTKVANAGE